VSASFRVAQLSDLHFNANPRCLRPSGVHAFLSRHAPATVRAIQTEFSALPAGDIDILVASGDVATSGDFADLALAQEFLEGLGRLASVSKVVAIPGNHDRYRWSNMNFFEPGSTTFEAFFPEHEPFSATLLADLEREGSRMVVVGLDLSLNPSDSSIPYVFWQRLGCGAAYSTPLAQALAITNAVRVDGGPNPYVVWVCHFPPDARSTLALLEQDQLRQATQAASVNLVLFGHTHENGIVNMGARTVKGRVCSTTTEHSQDQRKREKRSYALIDIEVDSTGSGKENFEHYHWNDRAHQFL
jgi:predicted phosphodiesterase